MGGIGIKALLAIGAVAGALLVGPAEGYALAWGPSAGIGGSGVATEPQAPVPEPGTLYAAGCALALLAGATWYFRRRK